MKKMILFSLLAASCLSAGNLVVTQGVVKAHTEVFGDSTIDPQTTGLTSHLSMNGDPSTLGGSIEIAMTGLKSDNDGRDEHMYEAIDTSSFPKATYTIQSVKPSNAGYTVEGMLDFHGAKKPLSINAQIDKTGNNVYFKGNSSFLMSDYDVKPPRLLLLTVRDQIDLTVDVTFNNK